MVSRALAWVASFFAWVKDEGTHDWVTLTNDRRREWK